MPRAATASAGLDRQRLLAALSAFRKGDFSVRLPTTVGGIDGEIAEAFNDVVELNDRMTKEFERLGEVGRQAGQDQPPRQAAGRARAPGRPASRRSTP